MPGICGIISKAQHENNLKDLNIMVHSMMHEPYYSSGTYINEHLGLYIGWIAHKYSFSDCMPLLNENKNLILIFAGENFSDKSVINELGNKGHKFDSDNASYLIHLYEENNEDFIYHLNGNFNGILIDLQRNKAILFNDRFGMLRLYFFESKECLLFSSEAKSLLKVRPESRKIDLKSMGEFLSCNCVLENRTLFSDIFLLPGGSFWKFEKNQKVTKNQYFRPVEWENQPILEKEIFYQRLKETFSRILPKYFNSDNPIALSLTGGLDTRMILANLNNSSLELQCYTHAGKFHDSFDLKIARKVAQICNLTHHTIQLDRNFLDNFAALAEKSVYISDGNLDLSGAVNIYMNKLVREIAQVRITGNHGSELFRSVGWIKAMEPGNRLFHPDFKKYIHESRETLRYQKIGHPLTFSHFKEAAWHEYNRLAVEQSQLMQRTPYMDIELVKLMYQAPSEVRRNNKISLRLIEDGNPRLRKIMTDRGIGGNANFLFSIGARLYHEFLFKMDYYYNHGMPQWLAILNYHLSPLNLEKIFLGRHKYYHYRIWFRDEWSDYVRQILLDERTMKRPYFSKGIIEEMVTNHIKGTRNYTTEIDMILTTELTHRLLIEQN